jgi:hypothetical protein
MAAEAYRHSLLNFPFRESGYFRFVGGAYSLAMPVAAALLLITREGTRVASFIRSQSADCRIFEITNGWDDRALPEPRYVFYYLRSILPKLLILNDREKAFLTRACFKNTTGA